MSDLIDDFKHVRDNRIPSVTGAVKIMKIYHYLRNNNCIPDIDIPTFRKIIRTMGKNISQLIMDGYAVSLPLAMGHFSVMEYKPDIRFVNGKVKHNYKINWGETLRLWETDNEARQKKLLVYHVNERLLSIKYYRRRAKFKNKVFFLFRPTSAIKRNINKYAKENKIVYYIK